jgi:glycosyltransferase involved in cell wall biosynthesis
VGAGPEEAALKALRQALRLETAVRFTGNIPPPEVWFQGSTLFVLSSRHEAMPNALLEAAAGGLPIVALPAQGGIAELLQGNPGIWLASDISAKALEQSLSAALQALQPGERFPHVWIDHFRMDRSIALYEELIDETLTESSKSGV